MKRLNEGPSWASIPALPLAASCGAGIVMADSCSGTEQNARILLAASLVTGTLLLPSVCRHFIVLRSLARSSVAIAILFAVGFLSFNRVVDYAPVVVPDSSPAMTIEARIARHAGASARNVRLILSDITLTEPGKPLRGKILAYVPLDPVGHTSRIVEGATIRLTGRMAALPIRRNPADFDFGNYLRRRGVRARFFADAETYRVVSEPSRLLILASRIQILVRSAISQHVSGAESRAVITALLLGDRALITPDMRERFVTSGLIHLLAVSGLHVMIVGMAFYRLLMPLLLRGGLTWDTAESLRAPATIILLVTYMFVTGRPPSVVRAVVMTSVLILGPVARKSVQPLNSLALAAVAILVAAPWSLFEAGFQLSVSAVACILTVVPAVNTTPAWTRVRRVAGTSISNSTLVTVAATLGTAPILLAHFGRLSLAGLVLNVPAIPITAVALGASVLCTISVPAPQLAGLYGNAADLATRTLIGVANFGDEYLKAVSITGYPGALSVAALVLLLTGIACCGISARMWKFVGLSLALLSASSLTRFIRVDRHNSAEVVFFDVGHGDSALLTTESGTAVLVDTGDNHNTFSSARHVILPHLRRHGIEKIDILILTHAHSDHIAAAPELLRSLNVGRIIHQQNLKLPSRLDDILAVGDSLRIPSRKVAAGDTLIIDRNTRAYILGPSNEQTRATENDRSIVLKIQLPHRALLFTGDAERFAELSIAHRYQAFLRADVVKVPHHGSQTSSTDALVSHASRKSGPPTTAVISVGSATRYGLPDSVVLKRWQNAGAALATTADEGAVWLRMAETVDRVEWRTN